MNNRSSSGKQLPIAPIPGFPYARAGIAVIPEAGAIGSYSPLQRDWRHAGSVVSEPSVGRVVTTKSDHASDHATPWHETDHAPDHADHENQIAAVQATTHRPRTRSRRSDHVFPPSYKEGETYAHRPGPIPRETNANRQATPEAHAAYRQGLCIDCRATRYSAGRPRCNSCHAAYIATQVPPPALTAERAPTGQPGGENASTTPKGTTP